MLEQNRNRSQKTMKISVVTAVFNRRDTIAQAIESVNAQDHFDVEHIIQDGGSTDGTLDVVRQHATDTTGVVSEPDTGIYDAINRGILRANGDVVGVMHSDDYFASDDVLSKVASAFKDPNVDGVYGDLSYVAASDTSRVLRHWKSGPYDASKLRWGWMPPHPTFYMRRHLFDQLGFYDTEFQIAADYDAMLRYFVQGRIKLAYIPEVLVCMRTGGASNGSLKRILRKSREDYTAIRRNHIGGLGTLAAKNFSKVTQFL
ncbi:MAG: glycosyltransferase family 2 protein [Roseovarius sp.]